MIIGKYNYRHNVIKSRDFCNGNMINGQALNTVSEMRYGLCHMSFNGCEVISVYNALAYLKKTDIERYRALIEKLGLRK